MLRNFTITFIIVAAFCFVPNHRSYDNGPSLLPALRNNVWTILNLCQSIISSVYLNSFNNKETDIMPVISCLPKVIQASYP
jgi:hypothetical protein